MTLSYALARLVEAGAVEVVNAGVLNSANINSLRHVRHYFVPLCSVGAMRLVVVEEPVAINPWRDDNLLVARDSLAMLAQVDYCS